MKIREMTAGDIDEVIEIGSQEENFSVSPQTDEFWEYKHLVASINSQNDVLLVAENNQKNNRVLHCFTPQTHKHSYF